ncbi:CoA transferase subunit A [Streptomyces sp. NPDC058251]|uniref:CoA transferase subunit A n=1 Tax=unclassified Streptomyces TaxID=2593676 RepID=UPI0036E69BC1
MSDKTMSAEEAVARLESGMTLGIGGWGSRRKPMALVRALLRTEITDLTVVSYGGPDVGLLAAAGRIRKLVTAFATLDSIPLEPHYRAARESGAFELMEVDEAMFMWGLHAAANRLPFLPVRAGIGSDVMRVNPGLRTVTSPYADASPGTGTGKEGSGSSGTGKEDSSGLRKEDSSGSREEDSPGIREEFVAMPALRLDAALVHMNRADRSGNGQYLGPDPYFDDLFCEAADTAYVSCERIVDTAELTKEAAPQTLLLNRSSVTGVAETPNGAHFTSCVPDYGRDEAFQKLYATTPYAEFAERFLGGDEQTYQSAVRAWHKEQR